MSREFGSYSGGEYFHSKVSAAVDDAKTGSSRGAKIMAAFLEPLSEIAFDVSSEEAGDSSEDRVVGTCYRKLQELESALYALKEFVRPAKSLAVDALVEMLSPTVKIEVVTPDKAWNVISGKIPWDLSSDVACALVHRKLNTGFSTRCHASYRCGDETTTYSVTEWDSKEGRDYLSFENQKLKERIAFLETQVAKEKLDERD